MTDPSETGSADPSSYIQPPLRFSGIIASSGRVYMAVLRRSFFPFALTALFTRVAPVLLSLDILEDLTLPLALLMILVLPPLLLSFMVAQTAVLADGLTKGEYVTTSASFGRLRGLTRDMFLSGLMAGAISLAVARFLPLLWLLFFSLFLGPPILMQVIAVEKLDIRAAGTRTRALMQGHWARILMALAAICLGVGLLETTMLGLTFEAVKDSGAGVAIPVLLLVRMAISGFLYPFVAAAAYVCYYDVKAASEEASVAE